MSYYRGCKKLLYSNKGIATSIHKTHLLKHAFSPSVICTTYIPGGLSTRAPFTVITYVHAPDLGYCISRAYFQGIDGKPLGVHSGVVYSYP